MGKLRRKSKNPIRKAKDEADYSLQCAYRRNYNKKCECGCGRLFNLVHHHILKSQSNFLRYHKDNLIFLAKFCHDKLHFGDLQIVARYTANKGKKWVAKMDKLKQISRSPYSLKELLKEKQKWDLFLIKKDDKIKDDF